MHDSENSFHSGWISNPNSGFMQSPQIVKEPDIELVLQGMNRKEVSYTYDV